jgi:hypothetical protein
LLERIKFESFWLGSPAFADVFVRREAFQGLQPPSVVVGVDEVGKVAAGFGRGSRSVYAG